MDDDAFEIVDLDTTTEEILFAAANHDIDALKSHVHQGASVNVQDSDTGFTPLHAAVAALAPPEEEIKSAAPSKEALANAEATIRFLFENGAIWNDLDLNNETPGCLAFRLGFKHLYELFVEAGVRAEILLNRLDDFEPLSEDTDDTEDEEEEPQSGLNDPEQKETAIESDTHVAVPDSATLEDKVEEKSIALQSAADIAKELSNDEYLSSRLVFSKDKLLDEHANGVMMQWESDIMLKTAELLLPEQGLRVLNIGHGMGIVDSHFQDQQPSEHHIIEAHPAVIERLNSTNGWLKEKRSKSKGKIVLHEGRWQEILPKLVEEGTQFDAIYFDTFAEDYKAFHHFFEEYVVALLEGSGRLSFFHGLGADRQVCYDVYTRVVEMDLFDAGLETEWQTVSTPKVEETWSGVQRKYWDLEEYRLPLCKFVT